MSADSGRRGLEAHVNRPVQVVCPQPVSDKSIIDSVAGIINDIVPQVSVLGFRAYTSSGPNSDNRETIAWAKFEWADINDPAFFPEAYNEGSSIPPLLLVLGYSSGVQLWLVSASGEATEVLSWHTGPVRSLRLLPSPRCTACPQQQRSRIQEDLYQAKRPLVALCDASGSQPHYHSVSFMSLRTGETVKSIRFKSAVNEVLANKRSILVTFPERIAVFDARTFEDVLSVTTCYHSPGSSLNPVALGSRWMAYCERRLLPGKRSSGGCETEGVSSYTATVLYAAKSLGKGLRGLGETVASSLTGGGVSGTANHAGPHGANATGLPTDTATNSNNCNANEAPQPGVVSVLDLQADGPEARASQLVAHFAAHSEAVVAMCFDQTGALLMTADRRGHDFHVFRLQPHPGGSSLAAVHHLYVLHRGDTSAKVQDMAFSGDARWAVVSTSRGTSHVFPVAPYGGPLGMRTHSSPHVVNRLSRFHKSAGLGDECVARSHSPVTHTHDGAHLGSSAGSTCPPATSIGQALYPYGNPRLPPYPHPTVVHPLAQLRQPASLSHAASQAQTRQQPRQCHASEDSGFGQVKLCACFAPPRAWLCSQREPTVNKFAKRAVDSLFIMTCHGNLIQYDLEPKASSVVPREKVCDDTPIELDVEAKGQWPLIRTTTSSDINLPLSPDSPLLEAPLTRNLDDENSNESRWLSQVEIFTHAGPHRRLWMGPQFVFKTYNAPSGIPVNLVEAETVEVGTTTGSRPARSNPVNMPHTTSRPLMPVVIDGSGSSYEQSPRFVETYGDALDRYEHVSVGGENQLREDLAEAMLETSTTPHRSTGRRLVVERVGGPVAKVVNPLGTVITVSAEEAAAAAAAAATTALLQQQRASASGLEAATTSSVGSRARSESVCAEEGKWSGLGEEVGAEAVREHTEICAEMRPAREVAAIDRVPPESIAEVRELRALCAEAGGSLGGGDLQRGLESAREVRPESPSPLCAEAGLVDCHAWSCPPTSSDEEAARGPARAPSSSDDDLEHLVLLGCAEGDGPTPTADPEPDAVEVPQSVTPPAGRRDSEPELPDMIEIIDIDAMRRDLGEPEPPADCVQVVLGPAKSAHAKARRHKPRAKAQSASAPVPARAEAPAAWGSLLEANKENLEERPAPEDKRSDSELDRASLGAERSSSSDEASALLLLLPMDTEEESSGSNNGAAGAPALEPGGETLQAPAPLPLLPSLGAAGKKANRSKKKKRR
ncbi:breast carcinoma-amplified sequence 3 homolog isoform X2 [Phymastichus coffea]|uniref:breast carcinoma-amplified sequence 3 homolog isoform X2 n=1 Tax=Phymastichus coffea TaxID=108790 RepID=UPI00273CC971|nr:breast carcinoma-amplified sequence 3 homolog isoform X2 [Phymastichus coffea]